MTATLTLPTNPANDTDPSEDPKMSELKRRFEGESYAPDAGLVAEEIIRKLRLMRWARRVLTDEPDRTRGPKLRGQ